MEQASSEAGRPPRSALTIVSRGQQDMGGTVLGVSAWAVFPPALGPSCARVLPVLRLPRETAGSLGQGQDAAQVSLWDGPPGDSRVPSPGQLLPGPPCPAPARLRSMCVFN